MKYEIEEIAKICGGSLIGTGATVEAVFTDSRSFKVGPGMLFVAISGVSHDGHAYINELYSRGVRAFLIERDIATEPYPQAAFVRVDSSVKALQRLAGDYRSRFGGTVVGITGSNGKTIVKEWAAQLIPSSAKVFRSPKSYNSQIGVPLSLLMMEGDEDIALIEAGISEPGEMEPLAEIIRPEIGVLTNIGDAHQENFGSYAQKADEKIKLFARSQLIIYNGKDSTAERAIKTGYRDRRLVDFTGEGEPYGIFHDTASQDDAAAALAISDALGFDHAHAVAALSGLQPVAMRLELKEGLLGSLIINDSYNSDINSLAIALDYLNNTAAGRRQTLILSDILQSGYPEEELYAKVAELVNRSGVDRMIGIGERIGRYGELFSIPCSFHNSADAWLRALRNEEIARRAVLVKGNRSAQFERIVHALERMSHTTVLEIDLDAMTHNLNAHRVMLRPGTKLMAMVKASGYGNGTYEIAGMLQHQGIDYLAVAFADEGVQLRESGITMPIVVLNADAGSFDLMVANRLEPEIYSFTSLAGFAEAVGRYGERDYPIHIKLDTGMHRLGFEEGDMALLLEKLSQCRNRVRVSSIFSHLAASDDGQEECFTRGQIALFDRLSIMLSESLGYEPLRHIANSAAIVRLPEAHFDMVRLGIGLYGVGEAGGQKLRHVSTLSTAIVQIKELDPSQTIGYGRAGHLRRMSRVATVPIGYADGLDRHLGEGNWSVIVNGQRVPIIGRICMDTCMIDVTGTEAREGDPVLIFSPEPNNTVEDMARVLGTIPYEIMTSISTRVKRIYTKE